MTTALGKRIEAWRIDAGHTRPALGLMLQVDQMTVYGWERLGHVPSPINQSKLRKAGCDAFDGAEVAA